MEIVREVVILLGSACESKADSFNFIQLYK